MKTSLPAAKDITLPELMSRFPDEKSAIEYFEALRWQDGIVCPHCQNSDKSTLTVLKANPKKRIRNGLRRCGQCKKQFRVTIGTIFEDSHIPLNIWMMAVFLICGAKKGMSALQLKRHLGIGSYKTAWFMSHRIRNAMQDGAFLEKLSGAIEVDETYIGGKQRSGRSGFSTNKTPVVRDLKKQWRIERKRDRK